MKLVPMDRVPPRLHAQLLRSTFTVVLDQSCPKVLKLHINKVIACLGAGIPRETGTSG